MEKLLAILKHPIRFFFFAYHWLKKDMPKKNVLGIARGDYVRRNGKWQWKNSIARPMRTKEEIAAYVKELKEGRYN